MYYFAEIAMNELGVLLVAVFGAFGGLLAAFFKYMDIREKAASKERSQAQQHFQSTLDAFRESVRENTESQRLVAMNSEKVARATEKAAVEAKERNGHLGEQNIQITEMIGTMTTQIQKAADRNFDAITNIKEQHVDRQIVKSETVEHKEDK